MCWHVLEEEPLKNISMMETAPGKGVIRQFLLIPVWKVRLPTDLK